MSRVAIALASTLVLAQLSLPAAVHAAPAAPVVQALVPRSGPPEGGTEVTVHGRDFDALPAGTLGVLFDTAPATNVAKLSDREIRCTTPAHAEGAADVQLTIDGQPFTSARAEKFVYRVGRTDDCATAGECNDGDHCTVDTCDTSFTCQHAPGTDLIGEGGAACVGATPPAPLLDKFGGGCQLLAQGVASTDAKSKKKLLKKAGKAFKKAGKLAAKAGRKSELSADCSAALGQVLTEEKARVDQLRAQQ